MMEMVKGNYGNCFPFRCKFPSCKGGFTTKQCLQFHYRRTHGIKEEEMPKIEREIPYTISAYSGGEIKSGDEEEEDDEGGKPETTEPKKEKTVDVYQFDEDEEAPEGSKEPVGPMPRKRPKACSSNGKTLNAVPYSEAVPSTQNRMSTSSLLMDGRSESEKTGLLVMAALTAAENDIMGEKVTKKAEEEEEMDQKDTEDEQREEVTRRKAKDEANYKNIKDQAKILASDALAGYPVNAFAAAAILTHSAQSLIGQPSTPLPSVATAPTVHPTKPVHHAVSQGNSETQTSQAEKSPPLYLPPVDSRCLPPPPFVPHVHSAHTHGGSGGGGGGNPYINNFAADPYNIYSSALDMGRSNSGGHHGYPPTPPHHPHHPGFRSIPPGDYHPPPHGYPHGHGHAPLPPPPPPPTSRSSNSVEFQDSSHQGGNQLSPFDSPYSLKDSSSGEGYLDGPHPPPYHTGYAPQYPPASSSRLAGPPPHPPSSSFPSNPQTRLPSLSGTHGNPYHHHYRYF
jgi:hypothetical protein